MANDLALLQTSAVGQRAADLLGEPSLSPSKLLGKSPGHGAERQRAHPQCRRAHEGRSRAEGERLGKSLSRVSFRSDSTTDHACRTRHCRIRSLAAAADKPVERHHQRIWVTSSQSSQLTTLVGRAVIRHERARHPRADCSAESACEHRGRQWEPGRHCRDAGSSLHREALRARRYCRPDRRTGYWPRLCRRAGRCFGPAAAPGRGGLSCSVRRSS